jgi:hypothetical protein
MAGFRCRVEGCEHLDPFADLKALAAHKRDYHGVKFGRAAVRDAGATPPLAPSRDGESPASAEEHAPPGVAPSEVIEQAPDGRRSFLDRLRGAGDRSLRAPRAKPRRVGTERVWATVWSWCGVGLQRSGYDPAVGRCMQFQGQAAGEILSDVTEGTFLDTLAQPLARSADRLEQAGALLALPLLVGYVERRPDMRGPMEPLLRDAVGLHIVAMASAVKREAVHREKIIAAAHELGLDQIPGADPLDPEGFMLDQIFAGLIVPDDLDPGANGAGVPNAEHVA